MIHIFNIMINKYNKLLQVIDYPLNALTRILKLLIMIFSSKFSNINNFFLQKQA